MKTYTLLFIFLLIPLTALAQDATVTVNGMVCSFCAQGLKKTFRAKDAVEKIDVDLDKRTVVIKMKEGKTLSDQEITGTINDAGFGVVKIERVKDHG